MSVVLPMLLAAVSATAAPCTDGLWGLKVGQPSIFRFEISTTATGTSATWIRPENFETEGETFSGVSGPTVRRSARSVKRVDDRIVLSFDDTRPGATPDVFNIRCLGAEQLEAIYEGTGFEPFDLVSVEAERGLPLGPWDSGRSYARAVDRPTNAEMTAIFDADQADRRAERIDWSVVGPADKKRQNRTQALLDAGTLRSADDFYHAAFVFQHGDVADDYLKAHLLAMIAAARGKVSAVWIASATLDRYLQAIDKPQVLGTQYKFPKGGPATQEPYDRSLVSDAMRKALRVPTMDEQEQRRQQLSVDIQGSNKP